MYSVKLNPTAINNLKKNYNWYTNKKQQLGVEFLNEVDNKIASLTINPHYAIRFKNVRVINLNKFPYIILFRVNEEKLLVSVLAIFHTSQNPKKYSY